MTENSVTTTEKKRPVPRKLNQGMITALSEAMAKGNYAVTACDLLGITYQSYWEWLKQAEEDQLAGMTVESSIYLRLAYALKTAEAKAEAELVNVVRNSAVQDKNWLAGMTFLERRHPDRWGRRDRTEHAILGDIQIEVIYVNDGKDRPRLK